MEKTILLICLLFVFEGCNVSEENKAEAEKNYEIDYLEEYYALEDERYNVYIASLN